MSGRGVRMGGGNVGMGGRVELGTKFFDAQFTTIRIDSLVYC